MGFLSWFAYKFTIKPRMEKLKNLLPKASIYPTGSRYTCNPPYWRTDVDFLVYSEEDVNTRIIKAGYRMSVLQYPVQAPCDFRSWRKGKVNLIVTSKEFFKDRHIIATHHCKIKNFIRKIDRVAVHEFIRGPLPDHYDGTLNPFEFDRDTLNLIASINGPHGNTICQMYKIQHGLA